MSLKIKIFLLCTFIALAMGGVTATLFARSWLKLSQTYALLTLSERLRGSDDNLTKQNFDGWFLEAENFKNPQNAQFTWKRSTSQLQALGLNEVAVQIISTVNETHLKEGSFEVPLSGTNGAHQKHFVTFEVINPVDGVPKLRVAGLLSDIKLVDLSPWATPFLGAIFGVMLLAALLAYFISFNLNRVYLAMEKGLEDMAAGRLENIIIPHSSDPAVLRMSNALEKTVQILNQKDTKIAKISELANEDAMTGIPNYRAFENFVIGIMSGNFVAQSTPVLGIIDLDYFKKVNDTYGHQVGDFVLREVTRIISEVIRIDSRNGSRTPDFFARYGGEEFVVIFTSVRLDSVHVGAQRILDKIKNAVLKVPAEVAEDGKAFDLKVSASIGLAVWEGKTFSKELWIKEADQALYDAKNSGRGRIVLLKPTRQE